MAMVLSLILFIPQIPKSNGHIQDHVKLGNFAMIFKQLDIVFKMTLPCVLINS